MKKSPEHPYEISEIAVMPAAGTGNRLRPYTDECPKCLVPVNGRPLLDYTLDALALNGYQKLILVTGFRADCVERHLETYTGPLEVVRIHNDLYDQTNNIYSLWLGMRNLREAFTLIESDLIFDPSALGLMKKPDAAALDLFDPLRHNGTSAQVNASGTLHALHTCRKEPRGTIFRHKTVNIWSFAALTAALLLERIEKHIGNNNVGCFYELAIKELLDEKSIRLRHADFSGYWWDEIDTEEDLERVNSLLAQQRHALQLVS